MKTLFEIHILAAWSGKKVGREGGRVALKRAQDFIRSATDSCSLGPVQLLDSWSAGKVDDGKMRWVGGWGGA